MEFFKFRKYLTKKPLTKLMHSCLIPCTYCFKWKRRKLLQKTGVQGNVRTIFLNHSNKTMEKEEVNQFVTTPRVAPERSISYSIALEVMESMEDEEKGKKNPEIEEMEATQDKVILKPYMFQYIKLRT